MKTKKRKVDDKELEKLSGGSHCCIDPQPGRGDGLCTPERPSGGSLPLDEAEAGPGIGDTPPGNLDKG